MDALFGIHIGNTSACLSIWKDEGRVEVVANDAGDRVTPAVVQWTPSTCVVGQAAQVEHFKNEMNTVVRNKQLLNDSISDEELQYLKSHVPYRINKTEKHVKYEILFEGKQHHVLPSEILSNVIKKIYSIAKSAVGGNKELNAVLTVPLHFSYNSTELIKETAKKVGFNVLQVIDEPSSAALGAGLGCSDEDPPYHCLIYRIGGVSLDATVLLVQDGMFTVLSTIHKYDLGGATFTEQIASFLKGEFLRQHRLTELTERGKYKLFAFAENVKQILSIQNLAQCNAESVDGGLDLNCSVSRARFENMLSAFATDVISPMKQVIDESGISRDQIKKVVLCGGTFKIPKLQEMVRDYLTSGEILNSSPGELISLGAATQAGYCMKYQLIPKEPTIHATCLALNLAIKIKAGDSQITPTYVVPEGSTLPLKKHYQVDSIQKSVTASVDLGKDAVLNLGSVELEEPESFVNIDLDINKDGLMSVLLANEDGSKKNCFKYDLDRLCVI
ncbi:UNVERIFIED_CONTAM: hypothetical protein PYX00_002268 [Menopon gallinae]|uniref:Heat shock 70 kDa protein 14 n=1 Tax=Menopon gallinae TaxID=328185 RepID=A0AAW2IHG3_9NEOP